jgi:hypothetical protein
MNDDTLHPIFNKVVKRPGIIAGVTYRVTIDTFRPPNKLDAKWLSALGLTCSLGGVGGRTRRGFGSLAIASCPENFAALADAYEWPSILGIPMVDSNQINKLPGRVGMQVQLLLTKAGASTTGVCRARYSTLASGNARLFVVTPVVAGESSLWHSWEQAMISLRDNLYRELKGVMGASEIGSARKGGRESSPLALQVKACNVVDAHKRGLSRRYYGIAVLFLEPGSGRQVESGLTTYLGSRHVGSPIMMEEIAVW